MYTVFVKLNIDIQVNFSTNQRFINVVTLAFICVKITSKIVMEDIIPLSWLFALNVVQNKNKIIIYGQDTKSTL